MKSSSILKILNPVLAILLLNQVLTGILHASIPKEAYEILHEGGGLLLAFTAVMHLSLNWNWVKATFFKINSKG